jgi:hypothetical protein
VASKESIDAWVKLQDSVTTLKQIYETFKTEALAPLAEELLKVVQKVQEWYKENEEIIKQKFGDYPGQCAGYCSAY